MFKFNNPIFSLIDLNPTKLSIVIEQISYLLIKLNMFRVLLSSMDYSLLTLLSEPHNYVCDVSAMIHAPTRTMTINLHHYRDMQNTQVANLTVLMEFCLFSSLNKLYRILV